MKPLVTMRQALEDLALLGSAMPGKTWLAWRILLIAMMGEALTADERVVFTRLTGRAWEPLQRVEEFWGVIGRRGGKSRAAAVLATYLAALCDHSETLVSGERGLLLCISQNQRQAQITFGYAVALFEGQPMLAALITGRTADSLRLSTGVDLEVRPASFRGLRGLTAVAVIADEAAFWHSDETSANADSEILNAVRPSLATTGGLLVVISSPYAKRGEVWLAYRMHYGPDGDPLILVAQGASRDFNSSLKQSVIDRATERDASAASSEYGGLFRSDIAAFIDREIVEAAVDHGVVVRPPQPGIMYTSFCDPSGGSRDSFTCAIAHMDGQTAVLDCVLEVRAPFSPSDAVWKVAEALKGYRLHQTTGDRYGAQWVVDAFSKVGVRYEHSERDRSAVYADALPLFMASRARLLDSKKLVGQFASLERRTSAIGRDRIDHGPGGHDDLCNAAAGALVLAVSKPAIDWGAALSDLEHIPGWRRTPQMPWPQPRW